MSSVKAEWEGISFIGKSQTTQWKELSVDEWSEQVVWSDSLEGNIFHHGHKILWLGTVREIHSMFPCLFKLKGRQKFWGLEKFGQVKSTSILSILVSEDKEFG